MKNKFKAAELYAIIPNSNLIPTFKFAGINIHENSTFFVLVTLIFKSAMSYDGEALGELFFSLCQITIAVIGYLTLALAVSIMIGIKHFVGASHIANNVVVGCVLQRFYD